MPGWLPLHLRRLQSAACACDSRPFNPGARRPGDFVLVDASVRMRDSINDVSINQSLDAAWIHLFPVPSPRAVASLQREKEYEMAKTFTLTLADVA